MKFHLHVLICLLTTTFFSGKLSAQDCPFPIGQAQIFTNNQTLDVRNSGDFLIPGAPINNNSVINLYDQEGHKFPLLQNAHLVIGAKTSDGNIRVAGNDYSRENSFDFVAGPLDPSNGQPYDNSCSILNDVWIVWGSDIQAHLSDFEDNGVIDHPVKNIFQYPAHGNPHFEGYFGYSLPFTPEKLAPFFDENNDGIYDPNDGDYPLPDGVHHAVIPYTMAWTVFNDYSDHSSSGGVPLGVEVQLTVWTFSCEDNDFLNKNIFTSYKIINRSSMNYDSLHVGMMTDFQLGCLGLDFVGAIADMNTFYSYNVPPYWQDCTASGVFNFEDHPTTQSITFLNQPLNSFVPFMSGGVCCTNSAFFHPNFDHNYYWGMQAKWGDGSPLSYGGIGGSFAAGISGVKTNIAFPDHPLDSTGWSMIAHQLSFACIIDPLAATYLGDFPQGAVKTLDVAYTLHQSDSLDHLEVVNLVYENTPQLQTMYDAGFEFYCDPEEYCIEDCVWAGDTNKDSLVDLSDIFNIGLMLEEIGPARNGTFFWFPNDAKKWVNEIQGVNLKHVDANGNGTIEYNDFYSVLNNFGENYYATSPPDIYQQGTELFIENQSPQSLHTIEVGKFGYGKMTLDIDEDIFGLSFTIEYDPALLTPLISSYKHPFSNVANSQVYIAEESWITEKIIAYPGNIHYAAVKLDGENSPTKDSWIFKLWATAEETNVASVATHFRFKNIKAILHDGTELPIGGTDFPVTIYNPDIPTNVDLLVSSFEIFPNPTQDFLTIFSKNKSFQNIEMFDAFGKKVFSENGNFEEQKIISTRAFPVGIYFLKIEMEGRF